MAMAKVKHVYFLVFTEYPEPATMSFTYDYEWINTVAEFIYGTNL